VTTRIWFHRTCAIIWILLLIPAWLWWRESVFFVIAASIYANVKSDWAASEAADDRLVMDELAAMRTELAAIRAQLEEIHGAD
jgi:hypothetical protein